MTFKTKCDRISKLIEGIIVNTIIFYKLKKVGNDWYVIFLDKDNNYKIINNDRS